MVKLLIVLDGIGDLPCEELKGKTPLEAAKTKYLDKFTKEGCQGYVFSVSPKVAPESDVAVTALLGYDPYKSYTGRGPLEAFGADVKLGGDYLAFRANFSTLIGNKLIDRRAGRNLTTKEAQILADEINKKVKIGVPFKFIETEQHRAVLILKGKFSENISNVDPEYKKEGTFGVAKKTTSLKCVPLDKNKLSEKTAEVINKFVKRSYLVLKEHEINKKRIKKSLLPANFITVRDAGTKLPDFPKKKDWAAVAGMPLEIGLSKLSGMILLKFKYHDLKSTNVYKHLYRCLKQEIKEVKRNLKKPLFKYYYIHIKQTDIPGHDGRPLDKVKMIEILDKKLFKFLHKVKDLEFVLTGDHSTPCSLKSHSADPVPLLWYGKQKDSTTRFTEKESKNGILGKMLGKEVLIKVGFQS